MLVRISGKNNSEIIDHIKSTWSKFAADIPFEYSFLDQHYNMLYKEEARTGRLFLVFTGVSVFIAMLGLFGLASFSAIKRTREIGIRKVFGATAFGILRLLSGDFIKLVLIAFIISTPVSWYLMHKWLQEFAYKIGINPLTLAGAGLIVMIITILTVIYHSMQAANANPVDTLRHE
jgi:putative ABC transport system permease protein